MTWTTLDHETYPFGRANLAPKIVCTSWTSAGPGDVQLARWLDTPVREILAASTIDGANTAYDLVCQMATDPSLIDEIVRAYVEGRVRDVQLDWKLWDIQRGIPIEGKSYSLDALAANLQIQMIKDDGWRLRFSELDGVHPDYYPQGARDYAIWDTAVTRKARLALPEVQPLPIYQIAAGADWTLHLASVWGVMTDPTRTEQVAERVSALVVGMEAKLVEAGLVRRNGDKAEQKAYRERLRAAAKARPGVDIKLLEQEWKALGDGFPDGKKNDLAAAYRMIKVMTEQGRRHEIQLTDGGADELAARVKNGEDRRAVHEELLQRIDRGRPLVKLDYDCAVLSGDEMLVTRAEWVTSDRLLGRVEEMRQGFTLPLQPSFDSVKETFRTSSYKSKSGPIVGVQAQNFDQGEEGKLGLRECFCPRPGYIFIGGDFSQAELCSLAETCLQMFNYSRMGELLNQGIDLHWYFAASSLGITIEQVKALGKKQRSRAKPANFGFPGGLGVDTYIIYARKGYDQIFSRDEAKQQKADWLRAYPEMPHYLEWVSKQTRDPATGKPKLFEHVHPVTGYRRGGCGYTNGANQSFQSLTAVAAKQALIDVTAECFDPRSPLYGCKLWDFIHDELLLEAPIENASEAADRLSVVMANSYNRWTSRVPTKVDAWVSSVYSKNTEGVRVGGKLVDWAEHRAST